MVVIVFEEVQMLVVRVVVTCILCLFCLIQAMWISYRCLNE